MFELIGLLVITFFVLWFGLFGVGLGFLGIYMNKPKYLLGCAVVVSIAGYVLYLIWANQEKISIVVS